MELFQFFIVFSIPHIADKLVDLLSINVTTLVLASPNHSFPFVVQIFHVRKIQFQNLRIPAAFLVPSFPFRTHGCEQVRRLL